jgi:AraC-like DNA-binding protein
LLCGGFAVDGGRAHPILRSLPPALLVRGVNGHAAPWLERTLELLNAETASSEPGCEEVVSRLADALLTQALRVALAELDSSNGAGIRALGDPQIASAIAVIHRQPERAWTVGELASEVALSRSAFAYRFRHLVGESPQRYMTRGRLAHAAALLHNDDSPIAVIAVRAGYASEFSFARAFKRTFGVGPGTYRRRPQGVRGLNPFHDSASPAINAGMTVSIGSSAKSEPSDTARESDLGDTGQSAVKGAR